MLRTPRRPGTAVVWVAVLALSVLFAPSAARGAEPTLGGSLGASESTVRVVSRATVPVSVDVAMTPDGWAVDVPTFTLDPGEARNVSVITRGEDPAVVTAVLRAVEPIVGTEAASLVLSTGVVQPSPPPWPLLAALVIVLMGIVAVVIAWRRMRPVGGNRYAS
jgi:hypothetical protein